MQEMQAEIPEGISAVFISSVTQTNLDRLKDMIWQAIHAE